MVEDQTKQFTPISRSQWRQWLVKNHADKTTIWLVFYKVGTGKPTLSYNDAVEEALCYGWIDGIKKRLDDERYMHKFTPRKLDSNWSPSNIKRVARLEAANLMTVAGTRLVEIAKTQGKWVLTPPARPEFSMPLEFRNLLASNPVASEYFHTLSLSCQRQYIGWISTAKHEETRNKRMEKSLKLLLKKQKLGMV